MLGKGPVYTTVSFWSRALSVDEMEILFAMGCGPQKGYQFVWWPRVWWPLMTVIGPYPYLGRYAGCVYRWRLRVGPLEIRRWADHEAWARVFAERNRL